METITKPTVIFTRDPYEPPGGTFWRGVVTGADTIDAAFTALAARIHDLAPMGELPADPFCAEVKALTPTADGLWVFEIVRRFND